MQGVLPATQAGLEIGALHNPVVPQGLHNVKYVDYADTATLRRTHAAKPAWVQRMVDVDYVWSGSGSLSDVVGAKDCFDYAVASHVIEHVPNMVGWFMGIAEVLRPGGIFNLAIPDKRFTFDITCPSSTVGQAVEAHLLGYVRPSIRQMFDHCFYAKAIDPGAIWTKRINVAEVSPFSGHGAPDLALRQARDIVQSERYFDSHCWIFTPAEFLDLIGGLIRLRMFPFVPISFSGTPLGGFEFHISLRRPHASSADELNAEQGAALNRLKSALQDQTRWSQLLAG